MANEASASYTTQQVRAVLNVMHAAIVVADAAGNLLVFNDAAERLMGYGAQDVTPDEWTSAYGVYHPDRVTPFLLEENPMARALKGEVVTNVEMFIRNANVPHGRPIFASAAPILDEDRNVVGGVATLHDISPVKHAEGRLDSVGRQLVQAQKLEAVGRLAGGVAHDFNNQLSVILSFLHMAIDQLPDDSPVAADLREVRGAAERATTLTRQLLSMSRRQVSSPRVIVVDELITAFQKVLRRVIGEDVKLRMHLTTDGACIHLDPAQLDQVLMNLAVNARDAMPDGGTLTIETTSVRLDADYSETLVDVKHGDYVCIAVTDTGHGMTSEVRSSLFEPFFTTKEAGKGTGLGLSITHGIVKQAGGNILVYSEPGQGTTFKVYIPRVDSAASPLPASVICQDVDGTGRTVLLVEDDAHVREAASRILHRSGFTVIEAANADEARSAAIATQRQVDVLLTDVVMPGLSGPELATQLVRLLPGMRVVLMSGYPADALIDRKSELASAKLISKPFTPATLLEAVGSVMAPRRDTGSIDNGRGRVLLVEDEVALRDLTTRQLQKDGYTVIPAGTLTEALAAFDETPMDVVLSDINLPDGKGIELLKRIRHLDMDVPVILITGAPDLQMATEAVRYGAFRFLSKPVPASELLALTQTAVRMGRLSRIKRDALNLLGKDSTQARDRAGLEACFENALASLWVEFQPILRTGERTANAFEVLMRNSEPTLTAPPALLAAATSLERMPEVGRLVRRRAAEALKLAPADSVLFINLHAQDLADGNLFDASAPLSRFAARVVLEITEREAIAPGIDVESRIRELRALGYQIAVDDLGAGYSGLATFAQLSPDIVKLDMSLVRDIDGNVAKQKTVGAMVELCQGMGIKVVAEGVETSAERDCLAALGCDFLQGYYFARPSREFVSVF
jgi:PAS domain S-box-containing protein